MSEHSTRVSDELEYFEAIESSVAELEPSSLSLSAQEREYVWIAAGLLRKWRVVSEFRTFGEYDRVADAYGFLGLLLEGNPNLRRLA